MEPFEVMTSESQERMLAIVEPANADRVLAICERWDVRATVVGKVTDGGALRIVEGLDGPCVGEVPAASLHEDAPLYDRPMAEPADLAERRAASPDDAAAPDDVADDLLAMLADASWVSSQYDHQLFLNTVVGPGGDAAVLRLKHPTTGADTGRGIALTTDGNHRWCAVDPRVGTAWTVAEAVMNVSCAGAKPMALVNCLNFGNPEHPEVMWQLSEAIDGMAAACAAFDLPVIGGNVSLYNESSGTNIDPTPIVGVVGLIDELREVPPGLAWADGDRLVLLGPEAGSLAGSRWAFEHGHRGGALEAFDPALVDAVANVVRAAVSARLVSAVHDVSTGGLGVCAAEMAIAAGVGCTLARVADHRVLFSETPGRVLVAVSADRVGVIEDMAAAARRTQCPGGSGSRRAHLGQGPRRRRPRRCHRRLARPPPRRTRQRNDPGLRGGASSGDERPGTQELDDRPITRGEDHPLATCLSDEHAVEGVTVRPVEFSRCDRVADADTEQGHPVLDETPDQAVDIDGELAGAHLDGQFPRRRCREPGGVLSGLDRLDARGCQPCRIVHPPHRDMRIDQDVHRRRRSGTEGVGEIIVGVPPVGVDLGDLAAHEAADAWSDRHELRDGFAVARHDDLLACFGASEQFGE